MLATLLIRASEPTAVLEAAKTISLAFSSDPLIRWLRPRGRPWGELEQNSLRWQSRRIQEAIHQHIVVRLVPNSATASLRHKREGLSVETDLVFNGSDRDFGALALLYPPRATPSFNISRWFWRIRMWLLNKIDPVEDKGTNPKVCNPSLAIYSRFDGRTELTLGSEGRDHDGRS